MKALGHWQEIVRAGLVSPDRVTFYIANVAARTLGIDTWDHHFARLESGIGDGWYFVMQTDDPARIDRVVALAEKTLDLEKIAAGPADELGLGPAWADHQHLDFVLQDLARFPGKAWSLIRAGIRSPIVRNRHMALRALSPWGKDHWPSDAAAVLTGALQQEPNHGVRRAIETLLADA